MNTTNKTRIIRAIEKEVIYEEKSKLFGLLKWKEKISSIKLGTELYIKVDKEPNAIFLNGKRLRDINFISWFANEQIKEEKERIKKRVEQMYLHGNSEKVKGHNKAIDDIIELFKLKREIKK
jgi:hypothetical protein